jgi:hypothetical protein
MFLSLTFQLIEQVAEALEVAFPDMTVSLQPSGGFRERLAFDPTRPSLRFAAT